MQIIQSIREKGAAIVIVVIALSLIGFILMDAKQGTGRMFGSRSSSIGKVDGRSIEVDEFNKKVQMQELQEQQRNGGQKPTGAQAAQIREQVWNQLVAENVFYAEADKLGINFTAKELSAVLSSDDPGNPLTQDKNMLDPMSGKLDQAKVAQALNNIRKLKGEEKDYVNAQVIEPQKLTSISQKYFALLNASAYYPSWMEEKDNKDNEQFATISYVNVGFGVISDSTVTVSDAEIGAYVQKHKSLFKQEAGRTISYVTFSQQADASDSARTLEAVTALKESFSTETNTRAFLARNSSAVEFDTNYLPKSRIRSTMVDTLIKQPTGVVFGPYLDGANFALAKVLGTKSMPDSVKARHILVSVSDPQTGQQILPDSTAKKTADSILNAIKGGADFAALAQKYNTDATKEKGGDLGTFGYGAMVPEFNDFCFNKPVGSRDIVRTQFGYHIVEVVSQKGSSPAYKVAILAREIQPSDATINKANLEATKLSAEKDPKSFDAYVAKAGLKKITSSILIKENDASIGDKTMTMMGQSPAIFQDARALVRWLYEAKKGDVSEPFNIDQQFVVAVADNIYKEGTQDVKTARPMAEAAVRNEKKTADILKKLGTAPTLEAAAAAYNKTVQTAGEDSSITFNAQIINGIGPEPLLIGASFNKDYQSKVSAPIVGKQGIYVIKVNGISPKTVSADQLAQQRTTRITALKNHLNAWFNGLKEQATIKDKRSEFF